VLQAGRNRHEDIMESLELFGREVLPEFAERDEDLSAAKAQRLAPVIEQVMARKPPPAAPPVDLDSYAFKAYIRELAETSGDQAMTELVERYAEDRATGRPDPLLSS
jgi:hypothetical protein